MHRYNFLICYDIADEKRVGKIGKLIEKHALRVQRSVYLFDNATKEDLTQLVDKILPLLDKEVDDLRVYKIIDKGIHLGEAVDLENPLIF